MAKEICHDNISTVTTQRTEYRKRAMSLQKIACRNRTSEECNKSDETRNLMLRKGFQLDVNTMKSLSRHKSSCRDIENKKKAEILS